MGPDPGVAAPSRRPDPLVAHLVRGSCVLGQRAARRSSAAPEPRFPTRDPYRTLPHDSSSVAAWRIRMGTAADRSSTRTGPRQPSA